MDDKIIAITAISALAITATILNLDGSILYVAIAAIAGLAGFKIPSKPSQ